MKHIEVSFEGGLVDRFPQFQQCLKDSVYGCRKQFKVIAMDLEIPSSRLSRMLGDNPYEKVNFPIHLLPSLMDITGCRKPVYWLIERFIESPAQRHQRAMDQLEQVLPLVSALLQQAQDDKERE